MKKLFLLSLLFLVGCLNLSDIDPLETPAGTIISFAASTCPRGWLSANGQQLSQTTYARLFVVIGSTWNTAVDPETGSAQSAPSGGNFRVPNLESTFLRGVGTPAVGDAVSLAGWQTDKFQGHKHEVSGNTGAMSANATHSHSIDVENASGASPAGFPGGRMAVANNSGTETITGTYDNSSGNNIDPASVAHTHAISFDSAVPKTDGSNGAPRYATETRPQSIGVKYCIKY